jgi:hypothetical protein
LFLITLFREQQQEAKNMACKVRGDMGKLIPVISFFLGAALTAAFVIATMDINWRLSALASWNNNDSPPAVTDEVSDLPMLLSAFSA